MTAKQLTCILLLICNMNVLAAGAGQIRSEWKAELINDGTAREELKKKSSLATAVVNSHVLTIFNYKGTQVYVYSALSNENENAQTPQKWIFYFVPIMLPLLTDNSMDEWIFTVKSEVRIRLMLSNEDVEELARKAIIKKYDTTISQYAKFWDVAPLMIDSLMAYIVRGTNLPVEGVYPYRAVHPNQLTMTYRFSCSSKENAKDIVEKIIDGDYEIEMAFHFAGFKQITTNLISITGDQLKSVLSKTIADGGNKNVQYIHRNQGSTFLSRYLTNVKKMIYMENVNANVSLLSDGIEDQFVSLLQQGMDSSDQTKLDIKLYHQVWSSADLNPDRITNEIKKLFIYNQSETRRHNYSDNFFDFNQTYARSSAGSGNGGLNVLDIVSLSGGGESSDSSSGHLATVTQSTFSATEIRNWLTKESIETEWTGEKFIPKSFNVYKLTDIVDRLQVAIVAKQLIAESANGAIVRTVNTLSKPVPSSNQHLRTITGEIKLYSGNESSLPQYWIFCHGQALSRVEYQRLFSVIGVSYGTGNEKTTFNIPDFRGRVPLGVDKLQARVVGATQPGFVGGQAVHQLTIEQLPSHQHDTGNLKAVSAGAHTHDVVDPGHDHGGKTGMGGYPHAHHPANHGEWGEASSPYSQTREHDHTIARDYTHLSIKSNGLHWHELEGETGPSGTGEQFSIIPPYQTINYIIYTN